MSETTVISKENTPPDGTIPAEVAAEMTVTARESAAAAAAATAATIDVVQLSAELRAMGDRVTEAEKKATAAEAAAVAAALAAESVAKSLDELGSDDDEPEGGEIVVPPAPEPPKETKAPEKPRGWLMTVFLGPGRHRSTAK